MKIIIGSSFYELMKYGKDIDSYINKSDMATLERKVETKTTQYSTVLFFHKNFIALSAALFLMMISWTFIILTTLKIINIEHAPAIHLGLFMGMFMPYGLIYAGSVYLIARGVQKGINLIYISFTFIFITAFIFSFYYFHRLYLSENSNAENIIHIILLLLPLYFSRLILNTTLIRIAIMWTINERAKKAYWELFMKDYQSPRKKRKLRVG
jgi:uncharacterized membrane protein